MTPAPEADLAVGMECYGSSGSPCTARAKTNEEDFRVEEIVAQPEITKEPRPDYFPVYRIEKRSIDTMHMGRELGEALKSRVSYGGLKDKRAVAVQYATPTSLRAERPERVERERFTATLVGFVPRPLSIGSVVGNRFEIVLRDCCQRVSDRVSEVFALVEEGRIPNYFGFQRFGAREAGTHLLGKAIVKRDFRGAVELMLLRKRSGDDEETRSAREAMSDGRYEEGWRMLPPRQDMEKRVGRTLAQDPGDWIGALRAVPVGLRRLYTQAFQSFIFNRTVSAALLRGLDIARYETGDNWGESSDDGLSVSPPHGVKEPVTPRATPLVQLPGYAFRDYGSRFDRCAAEVMKEEGVSARDFYIPEMQEVSVEGGFRIPHLRAREMTCENLNQTSKLGFTLARGQYATVLLREVMKPDDPAASGLA